MKNILIIIFVILISLISCFVPEERIYFKRKEKTKEKTFEILEFESKEIYYDIGETQYKTNYTYPYILNEVIKFMKENEKVILIIEGHSDNLAYKSKRVNYMVSVNRALIAKDYIIKEIPEERVKTYAYSDTKPKYEIEKDRNRRIDFIAVYSQKELEEYEIFYSNYMKDFFIDLTNR